MNESLFPDEDVLPVVSSGAHIVGDYRFLLWRRWGDPARRVCWIMLNPSTADGLQDDPTIRRLIGFTKREGYEALDVVNLFGYRSTDPAILNGLQEKDSDVLANDAHISVACLQASLIVCAWGSHKAAGLRAPKLVNILVRNFSQTPVVCLGRTADGSPRHPLYVAAKQPFVSFWGGGLA